MGRLVGEVAAQQGHDGASVNERSDIPLYYQMSDLPVRRRVVTIGTFDGVHLGHQKLLREATVEGHAMAMESMVLTFEPIPAMVLRPDRFLGRICPANEKVNRIAQCGVDAVTTLEFSRALSAQSAEEFMAQVAHRMRPTRIFVGESFALGRNREGTVDRLRAMGLEHGFDVTVVERLQDDGTVISSSLIRSAVATGDVAMARRYLGRPFRVTGIVIHGAHLGRTIGFPTANVEPSSELVVPADGIYASLASLGRERFLRPAMTYIGTRPTVNTGGRLVETHLLDFDADIYGQELSVDLLLRLRQDQRFDSLDAMVEQLGQDEQAARAALQSLPLAW